MDSGPTSIWSSSTKLQSSPNRTTRHTKLLSLIKRNTLTPKAHLRNTAGPKKWFPIILNSKGWRKVRTDLLRLLLRVAAKQRSSLRDRGQGIKRCRDWSATKGLGLFERWSDSYEILINLKSLHETKICLARSTPLRLKVIIRLCSSSPKFTHLNYHSRLQFPIVGDTRFYSNSGRKHYENHSNRVLKIILPREYPLREPIHSTLPRQNSLPPPHLQTLTNCSPLESPTVVPKTSKASNLYGRI